MKNYRADVDGLRAVAIISVLLFHFFPTTFPSGFIGVDIFFVISGFLITNIISKAIDQRAFSFIDFYSRRIRRIFPGLILILAFALIFGWYFLLVDEYIQLGKHVAAAALFVPNIIFWKEAGNYFDTALELKPLLHLWSLGIEEQFYLLWPLILILCRKLRWNLQVTLIVLTVISFGVNISMIAKDPIGTFYFPWTRAWELSLGGILALSLKEKSMPKVQIQNWLNLMGIFLLIAGFLMIDKKTSFPGYMALLPSVGCLCFFVTPKTWFNRKVLSNKWMVFIGLISFPLYLWHWILLSFSRIIEPNFSQYASLYLIIFTIILSVGTYKFAEIPAKKLGQRGTLCLFLTVFIFGVIGVLVWKKNILSRAHAYHLDKITDAIDEPFAWPSGNSKEFKFGKSTFYKLGDNTSEVIFVGDSNMQQYAPRIEKIISEGKSKKTAVIATHHSCMPMRYAANTQIPACYQMMEDVFKYAESSKNVTGIVLGGAWFFYFDVEARFVRDNFDLVISRNSEGMEKIFESFREDLKNLRDRNIKVSIILNIPFGPQGIPRGMVKRSLSIEGFRIVDPEFIDQKFLVEKFGWINQEIRMNSEKYGVLVIDPMDYFCKNNQCITRDAKGEPIYKDETHYRNQFIRENAGFIDPVLD